MKETPLKVPTNRAQHFILYYERPDLGRRFIWEWPKRWWQRVLWRLLGARFVHIPKQDEPEA